MKTDDAAGYWAEAVCLKDCDALLEDWTALAKAAIEPNPFYEANYLKAVADHLLANEPQTLVLVRTSNDDNQLVGLFPVSNRGISHGFLRPVTCMSFDSLIGVCTPLVAGPEPEAVWRCFLDFINADPGFSDILYIAEFYADGPCGKAFETARGNGSIMVGAEREFERAAAWSEGSFADYSAQWSRKKARNIRSRRRKLEETGELTFENLDPAAAGFMDVLETVLELEKAGWKGREGTALACKPDTLAFAGDAFGASHHAPAVHIAIMRLDGRIIAGQINLIAQDRAFFIKSAYDEELSRFGPGVILYSWVQEQAFDNRLYLELDSCADGGHPLEEIWLERKRVQSLFATNGGSAGQRKIKSLVRSRAFLGATRNRLKSLLGKKKG